MKGLKAKFLLYMIPMIFIIHILFLTFYVQRSNRLLKKDLKSKGSLIAKGLAHALEASSPENHRQMLRHLLGNAIYNDADVAYVYLYDQTGNIIIINDIDVDGSRIPAELIMEIKNNQLSIHRVIINSNNKIYEFYHPVFIKKSLYNSPVFSGFTRVGLSLENVTNEEKATFFAGLLLTIILFSVGTTILILFVGKITKPLAALMDGVKEILSGNLDTTIEAYTNDEIGEFAKIFNKMTHTLKKRTAELNKLNQELSNANSVMAKDLDVAKNIQECIIPKKFPETGITSIYGYYNPMQKLGGDFYDVFEISKNKIGVVIADVCGHGVGAALITTMARISFRSHADPDKKTGEVVKLVNDEIFGILGSLVDYLSTFYCVLDLNNNIIEYTNAGHPEILLIKKDRNIKPLKSNSFYVGIYNKTTFKSETCSFEKGDRLILYTDGIVECTNSSGELYNDKRFKVILLNNLDKDPETLINNLIEDINNFTGRTDAQDDKTILIIDIIDEVDRIKIDLDYLEKTKKNDIDFNTGQTQKYNELNKQCLEAIILTKENHFVEAIEILENIKFNYRRKLDNYQIIILLGYNYYKLNDKQKALAFWREAEILYPDDKVLKHNIEILQKEL